MNWKKLTQPPWRTIGPSLFVLILVLGGYWIWSPGRDIRDGRHDLGRNGIWIGHGWLGADKWFTNYHKEDQLPQFRDEKKIREFAEALKSRHITDVFPHLCPATSEGEIPPLDPAQTKRFLTIFEGFRVMPWIGGPLRTSARISDAAWRKRFVSEIRGLFERHPQLAGVNLNVEPLPSGNSDYLRLLEEIKAVLPSGKILSVSAYPPPTRWHDFPEVHWEEEYFREVAKRCDQLAVMMYDTAIRYPKLYQRLMADWTEEVLQWSEGKAVLLGVPAYDDAHTEYHRPDVENLPGALLGIHGGLSRRPVPANYQGVAIYSEWEMGNLEVAPPCDCSRSTLVLLAFAIKNGFQVQHPTLRLCLRVFGWLHPQFGSTSKIQVLVWPSAVSKVAKLGLGVPRRMRACDSKLIAEGLTETWMLDVELSRKMHPFNVSAH